MSGIKPSRSLQKLLRRSQTYSVLSFYKHKNFGDSRTSIPFSRIVEKRESSTETNDDLDDLENRENSLLKLRGILKDHLNAGSVVRNIKFSMETNDKLGENKSFEKKIKRQFR